MQKPKNKKRPKAWHHTVKQDRIFNEASSVLDHAYTECVRCCDKAYRMVHGIGPLCKCCFNGWWWEER